MTELRHKFDRLNAELSQAKENIKKGLHDSLKELIPMSEPKVTEMYKIISCCHNNANYLCRVWFTSVPIRTV